VELGAAGATVFVAGRTTRGRPSALARPETIEGTAELVTAAGGQGIPVRCDFTRVAEVDALAARLERLDILIDDVWGGDPLTEWGKAYWDVSLDRAMQLIRNGIDSHLIALHRLVPLLIRRPGGLVVEVTDGDTEDYAGNLPYYLVKSTVRALGRAIGAELSGSGCTGLSVTPGFLRSEAMLENFGVTEDNWRDAIAQDPDYAVSETPRYLGRAIAALAADPRVDRFAGQTLTSWGLMHEYGFTDVDGDRPDWGRWFTDTRAGTNDRVSRDPAAYR
jgi:NAD(P)-dependent dehydrogenase (short-subunit alcohol dehydrogenase family)